MASSESLPRKRPFYRLSLGIGTLAVVAGFSCSSNDAGPTASGGTKSGAGGSGGSGGAATTGAGGTTGGTGPVGGAPPAQDGGTTPPIPDATIETGFDSSPDADASQPAPDGGSDAESDAARTVYDPNDFLHVDGTRIKNARGDLVSLYGTNLGGWLIHEQWMSPLTGVPDDSHM